MRQGGGTDGCGTHAAVLRGIDVLRNAGCEYNVLTLVTDANVREPERIYRYVRDELGGRWQQYTDHLESVTIRQWDRFLVGVLDTWLADGDQGRVGWRELRENPKALSFAAKKCRRHLSRISQMDFYDRIARLCFPNNAAVPCNAAKQASKKYGIISAKETTDNANNL